jgi:curved DNA-binding protein CbpA
MDYYQVLGVGRDASSKEIERAFRLAARRAHPDLNRGEHDAEARMKLLNEIRDTLVDARSRSAYDERLRSEQARRPPPAPAFASQRPAPPGAPQSPAWMPEPRRAARPAASAAGGWVLGRRSAGAYEDVGGRLGFVIRMLEIPLGVTAFLVLVALIQHCTAALHR